MDKNTEEDQSKLSPNDDAVKLILYPAGASAIAYVVIFMPLHLPDYIAGFLTVIVYLATMAWIVNT